MPAPVVVAAAARTAGTGAARSVATKEAAKGASTKAASSGGVGSKLQKAADAVPGLPRGKSKSSGSSGSSGGLNPHRILIMEFVICIIILALYPLQGGKEDEKPGAWMKKGSAMCGLFLILGLVSSGGRKAGKVAAAFGGIVTVTLLVNERSVFVKIAELFNKVNSEDDDPTDGDPEVDDSTGGSVGVGVGGAVTGPGTGIGNAAGEAAGNVADLLKVLKENQQRIYRVGMR